MFTEPPRAGPVAPGGYGGPYAAAGASRQFSCPAGALSPWAGEGVWGFYAGRPAHALWTRGSRRRARTAGAWGYASFSADGGAALGQASCARDVALSVDRGNLS